MLAGGSIDRVPSVGVRISSTHNKIERKNHKLNSRNAIRVVYSLGEFCLSEAEFSKCRLPYFDVFGRHHECLGFSIMGDVWVYVCVCLCVNVNAYMDVSLSGSLERPRQVDVQLKKPD